MKIEMKIPDGSKWIGCGKDGYCFAYKKKPMQLGDFFYKQVGETYLFSIHAINKHIVLPVKDGKRLLINTEQFSDFLSILP